MKSLEASNTQISKEPKEPKEPNNQNIMSSIEWNDTGKNNVRLYSIIKENGCYVSIKYGDDIGDIDRFIIQNAFTQLYYTSHWLQDMCNLQLQIGIYVRNGFHYGTSDSLPHITFCFTQYADNNQNCNTNFYHAYFDKKSRRIYNVTRVQTVDLWSHVNNEHEEKVVGYGVE